MGYAAEHRSAEALRQHRYPRRPGDPASRAASRPREAGKRGALRQAAARSVRRGRAVLAAALSAVLRRL